MLQVFLDLDNQKKDGGLRADVSEFLKSVLIEVVAENYRHLMYECVRASIDESNEYLYNPPLRSRERVISGIFATAISRVSPRSYPEARIDRSRTNGYEALGDGESEEQSKAGRVDYLSHYHGRVIACELKSGFVNADKIHTESSTEFLTEVIKRRWNNVVNQSKTAQGFMVKEKKDFPNPTSIALMTIGARRTVARAVDKKSNEEFIAKKFSDLLVNNLSSQNDEFPEFSAVYSFPKEFREFTRLRKGKIVDESKFFMPAIAFLARIVS